MHSMLHTYLRCVMSMVGMTRPVLDRTSVTLDGPIRRAADVEGYSTNISYADRVGHTLEVYCEKTSLFCFHSHVTFAFSVILKVWLN